jgi:hypothetical protein
MGNPIGTLAHSSIPYKVVQDAWKSDLLCNECEIKFCRWEDWTCKYIYDPFIKTGKVNVQYDGNFGLFAASLCFRYIQFSTDKNPQKQMPSLLKTIFENLRENLLKEDFSGIKSYLYVQFLTPITTAGQFPPGVNAYFFESIDGQCFQWIIPPLGSTWMVYVKLPSCFFLLSGCDLNLIFPHGVGDHAIKANGIVNPTSQSGIIIQLVADRVKNRTIEIQQHYVKMPAARLAKNTAKISSLINKQQYRANQTYTFDQQLLASWLNSGKP